MSRVIGIFTGNSLENMQEQGGSGYWVIKEEKVNNAQYLIFMRNHRENFAVKDKYEHGQAFMVAKIAGCVDSYKEGRKIIQISEYCLLDNIPKFKEAWKKVTGGQRYPISYLNSNDLKKEIDIDFDNIDWKAFETKKVFADVKNVQNTNIQTNNSNLTLSETIQKAKEDIAKKANVDISKVSIQVNF